MIYDETYIHAELTRLEDARHAAWAELNGIVRELDHWRSILAGPRVVPLLCFWSHFVYEEEELDDYDDTMEDGFRRLDSMQDRGEASTVGIRVGGCLITRSEWGHEPYGLERSKGDVERADEEHRKLEAQR